MVVRFGRGSGRGPSVPWPTAAIAWAVIQAMQTILTLALPPAIRIGAIFTGKPATIHTKGANKDQL